MHPQRTHPGATALRSLQALGVAAVLGLVSGCVGDDGDPGPPGGGDVTTPTTVEQGEDPPGVNVAIVGLAGGTGPGGNLQVGDFLRVTFTVRKDDGSDWDLAEMSRGRALVSGPTFNYQRVLPEVSDVLTASVRNADGSYTYSFATPIPAVYEPPYNDTPAFGPGDGELTGQPLLDGTYTVGVYTTWDYTVDGASERDAGDATMDFLFGGAQTLAARDVVTQANCNRCHDDLSAHGAMRKNVTLCLLCHTSGSEDRNTGGATPGESVDFRVMVHKIHSGKHLPSVLGVGTNPNGTRDYTVPPKPYVLAGFFTVDYSDVGHPVMPNLVLPLPRDSGYSGLAPAEQAVEDLMRAGPADCNVCHGDPDGAGPAPPPAQGMLALSQPTRRACGSCHDDIDWDLPYLANGMNMPPQDNDSLCRYCHPITGDELAVVDGHLHPVHDPAVDPGVVFNVRTVEEAPGGNMNGAVDPGEKIQVTMYLRDSTGAELDPADLDSNSLVVSGPTSNSNLVLNTSVPPEALVGPQPFTFLVPERQDYEYLGDSTGANGEVFSTAFTPHWNGPSSPTTVWTRPLAGGGTTLASAAARNDNFVDVVSAAGVVANDVVVLDDGAPMLEEYLRVQWVEGNRLWFASPAQSGYRPGLRNDHAAGVSVRVANLTARTEGVDYTLDAMAGTITELVDFGAAAVVTSYTSDFVLPATYGLTLNESPDLDESDGEWTGKSLVDGTYTLTAWGYRNISVDVLGEVTSYRGSSVADGEDFLVGAATTIEPYDLVGGAESCTRCHQDLWFHGGTRRGFDGCLACHGVAGAEDRPRYVAWGAPPTTGVQVSFREMVHKIHMGSELTNASSYTLVGFGPGGPPNNFSTHTYEDVLFPALPGAARSCQTCHDASASWQSPSDRDHPTEQGLPVRVWGTVCGSCHDSADATLHIDGQTTAGGVEACAVCHGPGKELGVEKVHKAY